MPLLPFRIEVLWSDALVWLLVTGIAVYAVYAARRPHLRAPWSRVARNGSAMAAATVLAVFVLIGLLDSIHYRPLLPAKGSKAA